MIPIYLRLTNFLSHVNSEINFSELDFVTLVIGIDRGNPKRSNGAGKSSLFDAITWALYEQSRADGDASTTMDDIVREGTDRAEVEFHFQLGEDLYRIIRSRDQKKRKSDVVFQIKGDKRWQPIGADNKKETNAKIATTIGLDYDVFVNSVLLRQHEATAFATMTSGERKNVVAQVLQLDHYDSYNGYAKDKADEFSLKLSDSDNFLTLHSNASVEKEQGEKELTSLQEQMAIQQRRLESLQKIMEKLRDAQAEEKTKVNVVKELKDRYGSLRERIGRVTKNLQDVIKQVDRHEKEIVVLKEILNKKRERILEIKQHRGDPTQIKKTLMESQEKVQLYTGQHTELLVKVQTFLDHTEHVQNEHGRIKDLDEGNCPTCYQAVTIDGKQQVLTELGGKLDVYKKQLAQFKQQLSVVKEAKAAAEKSSGEAQKQRDAYNDLQTEGRTLMTELSAGKEKMIGLDESLKDAQNLKTQYNQELETIQNEIAQCLDKIEKIGDIDTSKFQQLTDEMIQKHSDINQVTSSIGQSQVKKGTIQERIQAKAKILEQVESIKKGRVGLERDRRIYKELAQAFSKTGIQALILENSAIEIEKIANELLHKITDGRISIQILTQKQNQDGTFKEVFDVIITDEFHSSPYALYSGGEQFRIAFVIRLALSTLLARRSGVKVSAIFYDEAFTDLDGEGVDKLMEVFRALSANFRYQIVITHQSELKNQFDDVLIVTKTSEGSFITKK